MTTTPTTKSTGFCSLVLAALCQIRGNLTAVTEFQQQLINWVNSIDSVTQAAISEYTEALETASYSELHAWLVERDWGSIADAIDPTLAAYLASVYEANVSWKSAGKEVPMEIDRVSYQGAQLKQVKKSRLENGNVAYTIPTADGRFMTLLPNVEALEGFELSTYAESKLSEIQADVTYPSQVELRFPAVNHGAEFDLSAMKGMSCDGFVIDEIVAAAKFKMDHLGAEMKAVAVAATRGIPSVDVIDGPFIAVYHGENSTAYFVYYCAQDAWVTK